MKENNSQSVSPSLAQVDTKIKDCYEMQIRTFSCPDKSFYSSLIADTKPKNILDVGCGEGSFILNIAKKFPNVNFQAVEVLPNLVTACIEQQNKLEIHNIKFHQVLFDEHFPHSNFDIITARFSVEHMKNIPAFLKCAHQKLKPSGTIAITEYCVLTSGIINPVWQEFREKELLLYKKTESHSQISFQLPQLMRQANFRDIASQFIQISPSTVNPNDFYDLVDAYALIYNELDSQNWPSNFVQHIRNWTQNERVSATCDPTMWLTQTQAKK